MKKSLNNLKKAVPPKARIAILAAFFGIAVVAFIIFSILTSSSDSDTPAENGMVKVDTVIQPETKIKKNPLLSEDNSVNRQVADLNQQDLERIKGRDNDTSHFDGIDLNSKTDLNGETKNDTAANRDVVDLGAMFAETDEERQERESRNKRRIEDLETRLDTPKKNNGTAAFDRASYIKDVQTKIENVQSSNINERWKDSQEIATLRVKTYKEGGAGSTETKDTSRLTGVPVPENSISTEAVNKRREQYLARYNNLKSDLEKRVNGNTETIEDSTQGQRNEGSSFASAEATQTDNNYPSNKTYGAGEIIYAINDIEIVSTEANVVRASVAQNGDVYNAILLGEFEQIGDVLGVKFSSYTVDGKSYSINAVAIDAQTWKSGLADDVDDHYFSRYFGIISAALLEGYAETLTNTSQTNTEAGVTQGQDRIEKASERLQYSIGKVGEYLAPKMLEGINRPSTVTVNRDKGIGVMFMADFRVPARK